MAPAMNRRGFLKFVAAALPAATLSAEMLEYLAPRPTIFLPPCVIPSIGSWTHFNEPSTELFELLQEITRKAFVPHMVANIRNTSPLLSALIRNANQRR